MGLKSLLFGEKPDIDALKKQGALIIDVRSKGEYASGHAKGSKNIPLDTIEGKIEEIKKQNKPVLLCCASGMRSGRATKLLKNHDIEAYNAGPWQNVR